MTETLEIVTTFVWPGGVSEVDLGGKRRMVRVCIGHIECPERGLIAELDGSIARIPWQSEQRRDDAAEALRQTHLIEEPMRTRLADHVATSAYYGVRK